MSTLVPEPPQRLKWRAMAIDLGRARMGLAVNDVATAMALPHSVVERKGTRVDIAKLLPLLDKLQIDVLVVGLPPPSDDGKGSQRLCRQFALALQTAQTRPVWLIDEAGTTVQAHEEMRLLGLKAARRRIDVDKIAAARILDRWLAGEPAETP